MDIGTAILFVGSALYLISYGLLSIASAIRSKREHIHYHYNKNGGLHGEYKNVR
jgi:hypothetical protein